jgi:hypothetical protein
MSKKKIKKTTTASTVEKDPFEGITKGQRAFKMVASNLAIRVGQRSPAIKTIKEQMQASEPEMMAVYGQEGSKALNQLVLLVMGSLAQGTGGRLSLAEVSVTAAIIVGHALVKAQEAGTKVTKQMIREQTELFEGGLIDILHQVEQADKIKEPKSLIIKPGE